ncbi:transmembrane protein 176l.4 [Myripristis murdjan]|uniref:Uncharacterized LOC115374138 n=1 Tax=Myripristis murdjan TaxID=586833 RepID=A0A667X9I8_9TELE|nr:uncharacterized protein LOC115374138 [Myripristis murdjan]
MPCTVTKGQGVMVFTVTSDPKSSCPPMCQMLGALCYNPLCCSVSQHLKKIQSTSQSALGAVQIMIGLLNIGLGVILSVSGGGSGWEMDVYAYPYWLAAFFIVFGIICILSEKFPSPCLVITNVILNLSGVCFAIAAIVLYSINIADMRFWWLCDRDDYYWYDRQTQPTPSSSEMFFKERCQEGRDIILILMRATNGILIVLSVLQLCVAISCAVLGIKSLRKNAKDMKASAVETEPYKPLLEEVTANPIV